MEGTPDNRQRAYQDAMNALAFVTANYLDDDPHRKIAIEQAVETINAGVKDWPDALENSGRFATSLMIIIKRLIAMRRDETGATPEETLDSLGKFVHSIALE